jgi:hypothetical protein
MITTNMTTTTTTTTTTTAKCAEEKRRRCKLWDDKVERAQHRAFTRKYVAADAEADEAKRAALRAHYDTPSKAWFSAPSVTEQAPIVKECLNDVRARAKRAKRGGARGVPGTCRRSSSCQRASSTPLLWRPTWSAGVWRRDDEEAARHARRACTSAPSMD